MSRPASSACFWRRRISAVFFWYTHSCESFWFRLTGLPSQSVSRALLGVHHVPSALTCRRAMFATVASVASAKTLGGKDAGVAAEQPQRE